MFPDPDGSYSGDGAYDTGDDDVAKAQELADEFARQEAGRAAAEAPITDEELEKQQAKTIQSPPSIPDRSTDPAVIDPRTPHTRFIEQCVAIDPTCLPRLNLYVASRAELMKRNNRPYWEKQANPENWTATQTEERRRAVLSALREGPTQCSRPDRSGEVNSQRSC